MSNFKLKKFKMTFGPTMYSERIDCEDYSDPHKENPDGIQIPENKPYVDNIYHMHRMQIELLYHFAFQPLSTSIFLVCTGVGFLADKFVC